MPVPVLVEAYSFRHTDLINLLPAFEANTTEVFTSYGLQDAAAIRMFASLVEAQGPEGSPGYITSVVLETYEDVKPNRERAPLCGPAMKLLVGWTSWKEQLEAGRKPGRESPMPDPLLPLSWEQMLTELFSDDQRSMTIITFLARGPGSRRCTLYSSGL